MPIICSREMFTKKCRQQLNFDSDPKEAWHYNHVSFTPIAKHFILYCRLIYMLSTLYVRLTIIVKVGIPESFKVGWYPHNITGSSHLRGKISVIEVNVDITLKLGISPVKFRQTLNPNIFFYFFYDKTMDRFF